MSNIFQDLHRTPLVRVAIPFILGIVFQRFTNTSWFWLLISFSVFMVLLFWVHNKLNKYQFRHTFGVVLIVFSMCSGALLYAIHTKNNPTPKIKQEGIYLGFVSSLPQEKEKSTFVEFTIFGVGNTRFPKPIATWIYFEKSIKDSMLQPGNWLLIDANLKVPHKNNLPTEFDFYEYLLGESVYYTAFVPLKSVRNANLEPHFNLQIASLKIKKRVLQIFQENQIAGEELALVSALTIGYKKLLPVEQREAYAASGAMHVLAVSGLHVGILFLLLSRLLGIVKKLPHGKYLFTLLVIVLLFGFAFITGFSPSVTRATIMFSFIAMGKAINRQQYIMNTIAASALMLLVLNPTLAFKVGFQLSYVAVSGIVLFYPVLEGKIKVSGKINKWVVGLIIVSIVAQFVTAPLNMFYFHRMANYGVLANLLVIPIVTVLLNLTILLIVTGFIGLQIPLLGFMVKSLAKIMNAGVYFISNLPGSTFESIYLSSIESVVLFVILLCILLYVYYRSKPMVFVVLTLFLLFSINRTVHKYKHWNTSKIVVYKDFGTTRVLIKGQRQGLVIVPSKPQSVMFCPVWFFKNHVHEKNVIPITPTQGVTADRFCFYRQFLGFKETSIYIGNSIAENLIEQRHQLGVHSVIQLKQNSNWQVAEIEDGIFENGQISDWKKQYQTPVFYELADDNDVFKILLD